MRPDSVPGSGKDSVSNLRVSLNYEPRPGYAESEGFRVWDTVLGLVALSFGSGELGLGLHESLVHAVSHHEVLVKKLAKMLHQRMFFWGGSGGGGSKPQPQNKLHTPKSFMNSDIT